MGFDIMQMHGLYVERLIKEHYAVLQDEHLILTRKGKFVADKISADLFLTPQT
jgi:hypothetical protein